VSFLLGIAEGAVAYAHRSLVLARHAAGTNAITIHLILAAAAAAVVIAVQLRRSGPRARGGPSPWAAPFSGQAASRLLRALRPRSAAAAARAVPVALLTLILLYCPCRLGAQVIGGLDPNATVNAWGGPSYAGALLAHGLDGVLIFFAGAFLLSRLLPAAGSASPSAKPAPNGRPPI
jgi:hypothetical protein